MRFLESAFTGLDVEDFLSDLTLQRAAAYSLAVMGEAVKRLPADVRTAFPNIPWREMARTRDRVIHAYDRVEPAIMWETIAAYAIPLIPHLELMLDELRAETSPG